MPGIFRKNVQDMLSWHQDSRPHFRTPTTDPDADHIKGSKVVFVEHSTK